MEYTVKLLPLARKDLQEAKEWYYNKGGASLAEDFKAAINKEIDYVGQFPEHYQKRYKNVRQALVTRFPYSILYTLEKQTIIVIGIFHTSRRHDNIHQRK